jgi:hypothetical protein
MKINYRLRFFLLQTSAASALLAASFVHAADLTFDSSTSPGGTITVNTPDSYTIAVGSSATRTLSNAIILGGGTLKGGVMDNVATVSGLSGAGTSSTFVDANGVTIILSGSGTANTTANLTLASGVTVTGANQLLVGGGGGGGGGRSSRTDGGGGGGGFTVLTTGNLSGTLALTAGGGGTAGFSTATAGLGAGGAGNTSSIGSTTAAGGGGASPSGGGAGVPTGTGGNSSRTISGTTNAFTGGTGFISTNGGGGGGAGSSANGSNGVADSLGGAGGAGTVISSGVVGLSGYLGSNTFGGGGGGGGNTTRGAGGAGGGGQGGQGAGAGGVGSAGTNGLGGGGGGGSDGTNGPGGAGGAGSLAIQYAYNSNVAAGTLTLSGGITLNSTSTLDAVRSGGLIDVTSAITGGGGLNIASSASSGGVVRLSAVNDYTGATTVTSGSLVINGAVASTSVVVNGSLGGSGTMANATLSGSGSINPGNSPGILTAADTDPTGGLDYNFEFTAANTSPTWSNATASVNDVLRLTDATTPFNASLAGSNIISIYLNVGSLSMGQTFTGGFYTDASADFLSSINSATFQYLLADVGGTDYNGTNYSVYAGLYTFDVATVLVGSANFAGGTVTNGYVSQFTVIPEPNVAALLGGLGTILLLRRRR